MPNRFENLPPDLRHEAGRAACRFLLQNRYISLDEACEDRNLTLPDLWSLILRDAGLPDCDPPGFALFT